MASGLPTTLEWTATWPGRADAAPGRAAGARPGGESGARAAEPLKRPPVSPQIAAMTLTLFPIRLLLAAFMMLLAWPFALLASLGPAERDPGQPLALWRK